MRTPILPTLIHSDQGENYLLQTCWCHVTCEPGEVVRLAQDAFLVSPHSSKFLPTPLIRPQPVVTHVRPAGSASFEEARQTGETRAVYRAGEASFRRVTSLLKVLAFQLGCVIACGAIQEPCKAAVGTGTKVGAEAGKSRHVRISVSKAGCLQPIFLFYTGSQCSPLR